LITAAVFTKETALFAPIAAAITVFILKRDAKWSAAMLAPLLIWIVARWLSFGAVLGGTFASPASFADLLANIGSGLMLWPSSAVPTNLPMHLGGSYGLVLLALLAMNFVLWAFLGYAGWRVAHALWREPEDARSGQQAVLLIWTLGALSYCLLIRSQARFGASLDAFLLLFLAAFLFVRPQPRYLRLIPIAILSFVTLVRGGHLLVSDLEKEKTERSGDRALFAGLRSLPQDGRTVFVVNAPTMLSAPIFIVGAWHLKLDVKFINQFHGCARVGAWDGRYRLSAMSLSAEVPSCASFVFAGVPDDIQARAQAGGLLRPGIGVYQFPNRPAPGKRLSDGDVDFGRRLEVRFLHSPATVLIYDWQKGIYVPLS
jgi:hypothetical protein